jgi:hypothetical protein
MDHIPHNAREYGIKCNVRAVHRFLRIGALCWVVNTNPGGGADHIEVFAMSRGGRMVKTWVDTRDLTNFRAAWAPDHIRRNAVGMTKEDAEGWAASVQEKYGAQQLRAHVMERMQ